MKISAKTDYACKALLELALHYPNTTPMCINTVADNQGIPLKFLTQIVLSLKQFGLVKSSRGKSGGYLLAKAPKEILLRDVVSIFEGVNFSDVGNEVFDGIWQEMESALLEKMATINFEDIKARHQQQADQVLYVI